MFGKITYPSDQVHCDLTLDMTQYVARPLPMCSDLAPTNQ